MEDKVTKDFFKRMKEKGFSCREYKPGHWQVYFSHKGKQVHLQRDQFGHLLTYKHMAADLIFYLDVSGYDPKEFGKDRDFHFDVAVKTWIALSDCCAEAMYERKRITNKFLVPHFGKQDIRTIKNIHLLNFLKSLKDKGLKPAYQHNIMKELKSFFRFNRDNFNKLPEFPKIKIQSPLVAHLAPEQQDEVFTKIPERHQRIFWFMRVYPVRPEEACGLRWTDVLMDADPIPYFIIRNVVSRRGVFKEHTKTNRVRPYPILPELKWIFEKDGNEFVFTRRNGKPHSSGSLYAIWQEANEKVDVPKVSLYGAMKHSRGWDLIDQGFSMEDVSLLMGHTSSKHTRRYAGQSLKRMAEILRGIHRPFIAGRSPKLLEHKAKLENLPSSPV